MPDKVSQRLASLEPGLRAKLENELLNHIEKTVVSQAASAASTAAGAAGTGATFDRQHDRGPLFGKDFDRQANDLEHMKEIAGLSENDFSKFSQRLNVLRGQQ